MFGKLTNNISSIFDKLKRKASISEDDFNSFKRELRIALLEADVAFPVVKKFIDEVSSKIIGQEVLKNISPAQMITKLINDELIKLLGSDECEVNLKNAPPVVILMVGLQGSGKTTMAGKLAKLLNKKQNKRVMLASLDTTRPAAQEQLAILAKRAEVESLEIVPGQSPIDIAKRAIKEAKISNIDVLFLDSAGRMHIQDELMNELAEIKKLTSPTETLLVADALTGQDAVNIAKSYKESVGITGIILTRIDGDSRGGAALSMKSITECPIKYLGTGEKLEDIEKFDAERIASRILGMGDVISLVEKAAEVVSEEEAEKMARKIQKGKFNFNDLAKQLNMMNKLGGFGKIIGMLPGANSLGKMINEENTSNMVKKQLAIINSMTKKERRNPDLLNGSRKKRIAAGSGTEVNDINRLIKQQKQMSVMLKKMNKIGGKMPLSLEGIMKGMR